MIQNPPCTKCGGKTWYFPMDRKYTCEECKHTFTTDPYDREYEDPGLCPGPGQGNTFNLKTDK